MKKGLRPKGMVSVNILLYSERSPDEEGIKTGKWERTIRPKVYSERSPDEEGIKTAFFGLLSYLSSIRREALMKKRLRPILAADNGKLVGFGEKP